MAADKNDVFKKPSSSDISNCYYPSRILRLMAWWKVWDSNGGDGQPKTVNIVQGYFFLVNFCIGTGFLGIPYSFFYSGYLAAVPTLILTAFCAWVAARWLLEIMARAQAVESSEQSIEISCSVSNGNVKNIAAYQKPKPDYRISIYRKFEIAELCQMFVGKWFKYVYLFFLTADQFLGNWSYASVAGSAWASKIPYTFGKMTMCNDDAFHHQILPSGGCLYSYYFSLFLFGAIVITLSMLDLKEQVMVQVIFGLARLITIAGITVYSFVKLVNANGGDACKDLNLHTFTNLTLDNQSFTMLHNASQHFSYEDIALKFDPKGWIVSTPVYMFSFLFHQGISSLTHPVKQKKYIHWMLTAVTITCALSYLALGVVVPLWFKASIQETVTLNWVSLTHVGNPLPLRVLSYYLIFFPSLDVISAYPLANICSVNNVYTAMTGRDTSEPPKWRYDWILRLSLRFIMAILPIMLAFSAANLVFILKYTGPLGFGICFLFPSVLQLRSMYVCNKMFGQRQDPPTEKDSQPLIKKEMKSELRWRHFLRAYMTPYSTIMISHPIFVVLIGCFGICFFVTSFIGLFIGPDKFTCQS